MKEPTKDLSGIKGAEKTAKDTKASDQRKEMSKKKKKKEALLMDFLEPTYMMPHCPANDGIQRQAG